MNRRDFLTTTGRYLLFGGLIAVSAMSLKNNNVNSEKENCKMSVLCKDCKHLPGCDLPEAIKQKS